MGREASNVSPAKTGRRFLQPLQGQSVSPPPVWLMRQAGRYLPEYRATRAKAGGFLDLCYNPELAAEVTLQPIRRYGFDAAILFSDILVVPDALGQEVRFLEGEGPKLDPLVSESDIARRLDPARTGEKYGLVQDTVRRLRRDLPDETALIGFCGAPWTVATYMIGGEGSSDQAAARLMAYRDPAAFHALMEILIATSVDYLAGQVEAGADALMIFDSWAGSLPDGEFDKWVVEPTRRMVTALKKRHPQVPIIGFPRQAGGRSLGFAKATGVQAIGCDTAMPLDDMRALADRSGLAVQGNLDPLLVVAGGRAMEDRARQIVERMRGAPFIFNLGHGIVPQAPPENVTRLLEIVRAG